MSQQTVNGDKGLLTLFGERLAALRAEKEWTVVHTAARVGCGDNYYRALERGEKGPAFPMVGKLARAFGVDETDLFVFPGATVRNDIFELLRRASDPVRARVLEFLRAELAAELTGDGERRVEDPATQRAVGRVPDRVKNSLRR